jgi:hypothetical protein
MKIENKNEKLLWFALLLSFVSFAISFDQLLSVVMGYFWLFFAIFQLHTPNKEGDKYGRKMGK